LGYPPNPFSPTTSINFGLPDTSKVSFNVQDVNGIIVYKSGCRLAGGNYKFDYGMMANQMDIKSGVYILLLNSDFERAFKSSVMHFEGTQKFLIVK